MGGQRGRTSGRRSAKPPHRRVDIVTSATDPIWQYATCDENRHTVVWLNLPRENEHALNGITGAWSFACAHHLDTVESCSDHASAALDAGGITAWGMGAWERGTDSKQPQARACVEHATDELAANQSSGPYEVDLFLIEVELCVTSDPRRQKRLRWALAHQAE
jgi:hypothetical protein